jgi:NADH:ubiquinone oxidoreductase subunit H
VQPIPPVQPRPLDECLHWIELVPASFSTTRSLYIGLGFCCASSLPKIGSLRSAAEDINYEISSVGIVNLALKDINSKDSQGIRWRKTKPCFLFWSYSK